MKLYPMKLNCVLKSPIWGGKRLASEWNKKSAAETVGESWELTVRDDAVSTVCNGCYAGRPLDEVIAMDAPAILGRSRAADGGFPLLIKLIDAADRLSVQVHPDDAYAARVEKDRGKTEMWYIVEAEEGAEIICGLAEGVDSAAFALAVREGRSEEALHRQKVRAGETYFIPAGLPHAIGRGILIAEIQQNCDLTYRVYDYCRRQKDGTLRELHVEKALDVIRPFSEREIEALRYARAAGKGDRQFGDCLADCAYFRVHRLRLQGEAIPLPKEGYLRHLLCIGGDAQLICGAESTSLSKGESCLLPAALEGAVLEGAGIFLFTEAY